jgi:hypothetical protein
MAKIPGAVGRPVIMKAGCTARLGTPSNRMGQEDPFQLVDTTPSFDSLLLSFMSQIAGPERLGGAHPALTRGQPGPQCPTQTCSMAFWSAPPHN